MAKSEAWRRRFVASQTRLEVVPLVPEVRVHTATELSPLWAATQDVLDLQDLEPPFWAFPWAGGQALARYVLDHAAVVRAAKVLDFATGGGIVGIAAALARAREVTCADIDPLACTATRLNARAAGVRVRTTRRDLVGRRVAADVILAGDIFYDREAAGRFLPWLRARVTAGTRVLVGDPGRGYFPGAGTKILARYEVPVPFDLESRETKACGVFELV